MMPRKGISGTFEGPFSSAARQRRDPLPGKSLTPSILKKDPKKMQSSFSNKGVSLAPGGRGDVGTSRSSCSSSVVALEETIADVMGIRMQSLSDLGARIEELSLLHRQEEESFKHQMGTVLQQAEAARLSQMDTEQDFDALLKVERNERQTVLSLMQRFKTEGAEVIYTMREALREAKEKWKNEVNRNAQLTAQLRQCAMSGKPSKTSSTENTEETLPQTQYRMLRTKVETLTRLLEEEDSIMVELQERNKTLEKKVLVLTQQRNRLLDLEAQHLETEEFNTEYNSLLNQVRNYTSDNDDVSMEMKVDVLTRFSKMLLQRIQAEQRQRLRVEEQTVRMASEHDQVVRALEARIKGLEALRVPPAASFHRSNSEEEEEKDGCADSAHEQMSSAHGKGGSSGEPNYKKQINEKHTAEVPPIPLNTSEESALLHQNEGIMNTRGSYVQHTELEAQLASVSNDFRQSIAQWNNVISASSGGKELCEEDFYPKE